LARPGLAQTPTVPAEVEPFAADLLKQGPVGTVSNADVPPEVVKEARNILQRLRLVTGGQARMVMLSEQTPIEPFAGLYARMGMSGRDLLVTSNAKAWRLSVGGLTAAQLAALQASVEDPARRDGVLARLRTLTAGAATGLGLKPPVEPAPPAARAATDANPQASAGLAAELTSAPAGWGFALGGVSVLTALGLGFLAGRMSRRRT